ncbi:MAG: hypothetical protein JWQ27_1663 [Ferruginibacter sp.]|nr:hypothetical protein [Ferruginibacter sp.]
MRLSVIIVNYNVKYFLEQCLFSVLRAVRNIDAEILVVDNASSDGSREYLEGKFATVQFRWLDNNIGFGKANNLMLKEARGTNVLFLNPDTIVPENAFTSCLDFFDRHPDTGALGVRMIDGAGRYLKESKRGLPSPVASFFKMTGLTSIFPKNKNFAAYYLGELPEDKINKVEVLAGAFMMLSRKAITVSNGFDERFFMYGEDVDLSFQLLKAGLTNYYFPEVSIIHFKGESTQRLSKNYIRHFYGAMNLFVDKHYGAKKGNAFLMRTAIVFSKQLAGLKSLLQPNEALPTKQQQTAVLGSVEQFNKIIQLLKFADPAVVIMGRVGLSPQDKSAQIASLENINAVFTAMKITQLIICEGELSFKEIIAMIPRMPKNIHCLFHASGSRSIVGSNNKNKRGVFIAEA